MAMDTNTYTKEVPTPETVKKYLESKTTEPKVLKNKLDLLQCRNFSHSKAFNSVLESFKEFNQSVVNQLKLNYPMTQEELDRIMVHKFSCGSERPVQKVSHVYERACSILRYLFENPQGVKKLRQKYSVLKRRGVQKQRRKLSSYYSIKKYIEYLLRTDLVKSVSKKGYITSAKGVTVLVENQKKKLI